MNDSHTPIQGVWPNAEGRADMHWGAEESEFGDPIGFDPFDFDGFVARVRRRYAADLIEASHADGDRVFAAARTRNLLGRSGALALGVLLFQALMVLVGWLSGMFTTGQMAPWSVWVFIMGLVLAAVIGWMVAMRAMPVRALVLRCDPERDGEQPDLAVVPVSRYRITSQTLAVIIPGDPMSGTESVALGFLRRDHRKGFGWTAMDEIGRPLFHIERRPGPTMGVTIFSILVPLIGIFIAISMLAGSRHRPLAIVSGDTKLRFGAIVHRATPLGNLIVDLTNDPERYADRRVATAAALVAVLY